MSEPVTLCGRGTFNGVAASLARFRFAPCVLEKDHPRVGPGCDSGPGPEPDQPTLGLAA